MIKNINIPRLYNLRYCDRAPDNDLNLTVNDGQFLNDYYYE